MNLKNALRNWLGFTALEEKLEAAQKRLLDEQVLRSEIADALQFVLTGSVRRLGHAPWSQLLPDHGRRFTETLDAVVQRTAFEAAETRLYERVNNEEFIDEIVERLRRKQLQ